MRWPITLSIAVLAATSACVVATVEHFDIGLDYVVCGLRGPGGVYGFIEYTDDDARQVGHSSVIVVAGHDLRLPFRITRALLLGNVMILGGAALYWYRRRNGKRPANTAS